MNRLFGKGKSKEPPPNLTDCIANVSDAKQRSNFYQKFTLSLFKCQMYNYYRTAQIKSQQTRHVQRNVRPMCVFFHTPRV